MNASRASKSRELDLQRLQQLQQIRMAYMTVLAEGGFERVQALAEFVAATERDPDIRAWAEQQRNQAQQKVAEPRTASR